MADFDHNDRLWMERLRPCLIAPGERDDGQWKLGLIDYGYDNLVCTGKGTPPDKYNEATFASLYAQAISSRLGEKDRHAKRSEEDDERGDCWHKWGHQECAKHEGGGFDYPSPDFKGRRCHLAHEGVTCG